jgi:DHA1 family multidrug resistance protein-like MFS transporter
MPYLKELTPIYLSVLSMRLSFGLVVFALPLYIGEKYLSVGIIAAAYPVAELLLVFPFGVLSDRYGRKVFLLIGLLLSAIDLPLFSLTRNTILLTLIHGIQGIAAASVMASSLAAVSDVAKESRRGREMGIYDLVNMAGYIIGFPLSGLVIDATKDMRSPFFVASLIAAFGLIITAFLLPRDIGRSTMDLKTRLKIAFKGITGGREAVLLTVMWFTIMMFISFFLTFGPLIIRGMGGHHSFFRIGSYLSALIAILAITQPLYGYISDLIGRTKALLTGSISIFLLLITIYAWHAGFMKYHIAIPLIAILGLGSLMFSPAGLAFLADISKEGARGSFMGFYSFIMNLGNVLGPVMGGALMSAFGPRDGISAMILLGAILTGSSVLIFMIKKKKEGSSGGYSLAYRLSGDIQNVFALVG